MTNHSRLSIGCILAKGRKEADSQGQEKAFGKKDHRCRLRRNKAKDSS